MRPESSRSRPSSSVAAGAGAEVLTLSRGMVQRDEGTTQGWQEGATRPTQRQARTAGMVACASSKAEPLLHPHPLLCLEAVQKRLQPNGLLVGAAAGKAIAGADAL